MLLIHSLTHSHKLWVWGIHREAAGCQQQIYPIEKLEAFVGRTKSVRKRLQGNINRKSTAYAGLAQLLSQRKNKSG